MRRALLIGSELGGLTGVHRDVALMDEVLGGLGFATVRATGGEATADGILAHLRDLVRDTADGDAAVVYYAGHGGRLRNPVPGPGLPRWLQYVVPTDVDDRTGGRARCVLAEELGLLQAQLTARTPNVTTLLDCCHSARMARDADLVPRALDVAGLPVADLVARWRALRAQPWPGAAGVDGNPDAVRVVACSADESAYERRSSAHDQPHGVFTAALATVLTGADAATLTWRDVLAAVRTAVADRAPQRPEVEGPVDRLVFSTEQRDGVGVRPVRVEGDAVLLDAAALFGIAPGDTYALVPPGGDPSAPTARATVARIVDGRAVLRLDPVGAALPDGTAAWPLHVALGARPVAVLPADAPGRPELVTALARTAQVRVVDDADGALATVVLSGEGVQVRDAAGAPLYRTMAARPADDVADAVRRLARAAHVRDLGSGEGPAALPADVGISWLRVRPDGGDQPVAPGEHLFAGDRLVGRFTSTATERRYVSPVDVGLAGKVTVLGGAEPDGTALDPGDVYELGRDGFGDAGLPLHWPPGLPADGPRAESLITIVADARVDGLRALEQDGVVRDTTATSLGRLLADLATGRRDLTRPPVDPVRYRVDRLDVVLHPTPRPQEVREPEFAVDERPDPSFRLVAQDVAAERVTAALTGLTVHPDGALHGTPVRIDALAVTAAVGAPWQAATVRIGADATPPLDVLVHDGPATRFLDLAVWVTPDDVGAPDLADLLADPDGTDPDGTDPELATARAVLTALGVGALGGVGPGEAVVAAAEAAVATVVRAAGEALQQVAGSGAAVLRTSLPSRRWCERGPVATADLSFAWEVTDRDTDPADEVTGPGWELAAEFDRRAREPAPPDPGLLDALAEALDDEVLAALFDEVAAVCADDDRAAADRYAAHLLALAPQLPGNASRALHAVVDVHTADLYARTGDAAEARLRADRCAGDLADLLPELLGEREWVLACLADADGRDDEARGHALRARDLFAEHERWEPAAYAAEAAAAAHPTMTAAALADWDRTAQLWVTAGQSDEAGRCVEHACGRLAEAMGNDATGADPALPVLCRTARELALTHGLGVLAARLGLAEAAYATDAGASWTEVEALHERSRRELAALGLDPAEQRAEVARVDLALGRAALAHGRGPEAERLLAAALPALRAAGQDGEAQMCEGMLRALRAALHPGSVDGPLATDEITDPDVRAGLLLTDGLRLAAQGKLDEAQTLLAQAAAVPGVSADPDRTLVTEVVSAAVRTAAGDAVDVPGVLARIEARLAAGSLAPAARAALTQVAGLLRTLPAAGDPAPVADVGAALATLRALPPDHPERGDRAAALVAALVRGDPMADPRALRPLDELLEIADGAVPETAQWHRTRTAARLMSLMRALAERDLPDPGAAFARLDTLAADAGDDPVLIPLVAAARRSVQLAEAMHHGDAGALQRLSAETASFVDGFAAKLPHDDPRLASLRETVIGMTDLLATNDRGDDLGPDLERMRQVVDRLAPGDLRTSAGEAMAALSGLLAMHTDPAAPPASDAELQRLADQAERPGLSQADRSLAHAHVGTTALRGGHETDLDRITLGITHMQRAVAITPADAPQLTFHLTGLALGLMRRAELTSATADLREAGDVLTKARAAAGGPGHPMWQMVNEMIAEIDRQIGTDPDGHRAAVDGLQRHVWAVLTSNDLAGATAAARRAAADAADAARRCIASDDPAGAITALDAGRGLALFAATAVGSVADQLAAAGAAALELRWRAAAATGDPAQLSPDLRRAVLTTLAEHGAAGALLDPPPYDEIQRALRTLDADALVYLVPATGPLPGYAVCAPAEGAPRYLVLPGLATDGVADLDRFRTALQRRDTAARGGTAPPGDTTARDLDGPAPTAAELATAVERVCMWAWGAAMGPLVERLVPELPAPPAGRPPRLVLVPMGDLARVPWQAARRPADRRYAIEFVALSQAVSARLLCASAARSRVPLSSGGLVVGDPDAGPGVPQLAAARREALAVREVHYRSARYLGRWPNGSESRSGPGTAAQVRDWLTAGGPGAGAVLHLACHGFVDTAADPPTAYLLLAGGEPLPAADLVALMAKDPHRAVGLVVLAACRTGLAMTGYDEAYSLGTAFLAGGARTVLSTQWAIPDEATSVLMFMVHHYLRAHRLPSWAALRAAQLWMLDPQRAVPDTMPRQLRERLRPDSLDGVVGWAAFVHWGQ